MSRRQVTAVRVRDCATWNTVILVSPHMASSLSVWAAELACRFAAWLIGAAIEIRHRDAGRR